MIWGNSIFENFHVASLAPRMDSPPIITQLCGLPHGWNSNALRCKLIQFGFKLLAMTTTPRSLMVKQVRERCCMPHHPQVGLQQVEVVNQVLLLDHFLVPLWPEDNRTFLRQLQLHGMGAPMHILQVCWYQHSHGIWKGIRIYHAYIYIYITCWCTRTYAP